MTLTLASICAHVECVCYYSPKQQQKKNNLGRIFIHNTIFFTFYFFRIAIAFVSLLVFCLCPFAKSPLLTFAKCSKIPLWVPNFFLSSPLLMLLFSVCLFCCNGWMGWVNDCKSLQKKMWNYRPSSSSHIDTWICFLKPSTLSSHTPGLRRSNFIHHAASLWSASMQNSCFSQNSTPLQRQKILSLASCGSLKNTQKLFWWVFLVEPTKVCSSEREKNLQPWSLTDFAYSLSLLCALVEWPTIKKIINIVPEFSAL